MPVQQIFSATVSWNKGNGSVLLRALPFHFLCIAILSNPPHPKGAFEKIRIRFAENELSVCREGGSQQERYKIAKDCKCFV